MHFNDDHDLKKKIMFKSFLEKKVLESKDN